MLDGGVNTLLKRARQAMPPTVVCSTPAPSGLSFFAVTEQGVVSPPASAMGGDIPGGAVA